ncbi:MAG TPA: DUF4142 domain-containing protein [Terriglobia bacterium]|jgi:putative membrane protein
MKNACWIFSLVFSIVLLLAPAARGQNNQQGTATDPFLSKAIEMNQAEIDLGRMAQGKAQDPKVKQYAEMMVQDHTQALQKLRNAAGTSEGSVQLTKQHQQTSDRLSKLTGTQFDKAYMDAMVRDHRVAVQTFQSEAGTGSSANTSRQKPGANGANDAEIARELLPTLQKHLSQAEQVDRSVGGTAK